VWLLLAFGACAPEDRYGGIVRVDNDDGDVDPATDPDARSCPPFNARYRDAFKSCSTDADCEIVTFRSRCDSIRAYAIASAELDAFYECAPTSDDCDVAVTSGRAEDGRRIGDLDAFSDVAARCVAGSCEARVERRSCGSKDKVCGAGELCIALLNSAGLREHFCATNPCEGEALDCACAQPACVGFDDHKRVCAIQEIEETDVFCKTELR